MKNPKLTEQWLCSACYAVHDDQEAARFCCPRSVKTVFVCSCCNEFFYSEATAEETEVVYAGR